MAHFRFSAKSIKYKYLKNKISLRGKDRRRKAVKDGDGI